MISCAYDRLERQQGEMGAAGEDLTSFCRCLGFCLVSHIYRAKVYREGGDLAFFETHVFPEELHQKFVEVDVGLDSHVQSYEGKLLLLAARFRQWTQVSKTEYLVEREDHIETPELDAQGLTGAIPQLLLVLQID